MAHEGKSVNIFATYGFPFYDINDFRIEYADLNELMAQDINFDIDDYFGNILDALYEDDKLSYIPLTLDPFNISLYRKYLAIPNLPFDDDAVTIILSKILDVYEYAASY